MPRTVSAMKGMYVDVRTAPGSSMTSMVMEILTASGPVRTMSASTVRSVSSAVLAAHPSTRPRTLVAPEPCEEPSEAVVPSGSLPP